MKLYQAEKNKGAWTKREQKQHQYVEQNGINGYIVQSVGDADTPWDVEDSVATQVKKTKRVAEETEYMEALNVADRVYADLMESSSHEVAQAAMTSEFTEIAFYTSGGSALGNPSLHRPNFTIFDAEKNES